MMFAIDVKDLETIDAWLHTTVYPSMIQAQVKSGKHDVDYDSMGRPIPYMGAIGGGLTFHFTPTSLGTVVKASFGEHTLDLTDYESW